jgi:hypothetical protein
MITNDVGLRIGSFKRLSFWPFWPFGPFVVLTVCCFDRFPDRLLNAVALFKDRACLRGFQGPIVVLYCIVLYCII